MLDFEPLLGPQYWFDGHGLQNCSIVVLKKNNSKHSHHIFPFWTLTPLWAPVLIKHTGIIVFVILNFHYIYKLWCRYWHFWFSCSLEEERPILTLSGLYPFEMAFVIYVNDGDFLTHKVQLNNSREIKMWKVYKHTDGETADWQQVVRKCYLNIWAKNYRNMHE